MTQPTTLQTNRLILRAPTPLDWPAFADLLASDRARYMGGPYTEHAAWGLFCHGIACWPLFGSGALSIEDRETGQWLGQVEINHGPLFPAPELGWQLATQAEGQGYAYEAARTFRDWALTAGGLTTLVSYIHPENTRSIRLAERLLATPDDHAARQDPEDFVYRHKLPSQERGKPA